MRVYPNYLTLKIAYYIIQFAATNKFCAAVKLRAALQASACLGTARGLPKRHVILQILFLNAI